MGELKKKNNCHILKPCNNSDTELEDNPELLNVFSAGQCHNVINILERYSDESRRSQLKREEGRSLFYLGAHCKNPS